MIFFFFLGFVLFSHVIFGIRLSGYTSFLNACVSCFKLLLANFDFWELFAVNNSAAICFVFTFLFFFKFFFLSMFFAIMDKFFVAGEAPPINFKHTFKPALSRIIRWIEWDDDYSMSVANQTVEKEKPISRAGRVRYYSAWINQIRNGGHHFAANDADEGYMSQSKSLIDVCDVDEKMQEVLRWSRDEAKRFVEQYRRLQVQKQEFSNDEVFRKQKVKAVIEKDLKVHKDAMDEAERHQRYAILVNEAMERRDQETLSKYIIRLEDKITKKMIEKHSLLTDVYHLRAESERMRYSDDDMKRIADEDATVHDKQHEAPEQGELEDGEDGDKGDDDANSSDQEYAQPSPEAIEAQAATARARGTPTLTLI